MKKFMIALSVLAVLALVASPSYALKGIDDSVPGVEFQVPFIVKIGTTGLDTLVIIQNISTNATIYGPSAGVAKRGKFHWWIYTKTSAHVGDQYVKLSAGDVEALSIRDLIKDWVSSKSALEYDLDGDGTNDHYVGYIYFFNETAAGGNTLEDTVAYFEYVDLDNGQASGTFAAMREYLGPAVGGTPAVPEDDKYLPAQAVESTSNIGTINVENFTPDGYAASWFRERNSAVPATLATFIQFTPRWYIHNADSETYIIIWKSKNHISATGSLTSGSWVDIVTYDNEETPASNRLYLPYELNIIKASDIVAPVFLGSYPAAGWVNIKISGTTASTAYSTETAPALGYNWNETGWLVYVWQTANSATGSLNWSALWNDRKVGTM